MVRAGVVGHPGDWPHGGYWEVQSPPMRYRIIDIPTLMGLCGSKSLAALQELLSEWVVRGLAASQSGREEKWSQGIAVGNDAFIESIRSSLAMKTRNKQTVTCQEGNAVKQERCSYDVDFDGKKGVLRGDNRHIWDIS
jgi:putative transposase